jgi:hypothetical protein
MNSIDHRIEKDESPYPNKYKLQKTYQDQVLEAETEEKSPKDSINHLDMNNELYPSHPILPIIIESDSDARKDDLKWDIYPLLNRR